VKRVLLYSPSPKTDSMSSKGCRSKCRRAWLCKGGLGRTTNVKSGGSYVCSVEWFEPDALVRSPWWV
jgi:hypothetical protein